MNLLGKGGVKVTEAVREVAPWTGVPGGALSRQGEAEAVLNLLRPRRVEVLEHAVAEAMTAVG